MRVLVTGAAGFIGGNVVEHLRAVGHTAVGYDMRPGEFVDVTGDFTAEGAFAEVAECDAVCHLGGVGDVYVAAQNPILAFTANLIGTQRVVEAAQAGKFGKIVYASTWEVYGEPHYQPLDEEHPTVPDHPYNISKLAGELAVRSALNPFPWVALRLGTTFGPRMRPNGVIPLFIRKGLEGATLRLEGGGEQYRQFAYITDICAGFARALTGEVQGVFNLVPPEKTTIRQIAEAVKAKCPALSLELAPARAADVPAAMVSSERAKKVLGWEPQVSFSEGFERLFSWLQQGAGV